MKKRGTRNKPYYSLKTISEMIQKKEYEMIGSAQKNAKECFGWDKNDILKAITKLKPKDFYKSTQHYTNPAIYVDYYKAKGLMGENVYTHFHVDDGKLVISSFKEI